MTEYEQVTVDTNTDSWVEASDDFMNDDGVNVTAGITAAPGIGHANVIGSTIWDMATGEADAEAATVQVLASVTDLGMGLASLASDPLGALVGWGVDILVPLIEPLENLIHEVSGNPDQMRDTATVWGRIAEADAHISEGIAETLTPMADWSTQDGAKAREKIDDIAASMHQLAGTCNGAQTILGGAQALAECIKEFIKWLMSQLIKFFIMYIAPQLAASIATFGATAASALGLAVKEAASVTIKAVDSTNRIIAAFAKLAQAMANFAVQELPGIVVASLQYSSTSMNPSGQDSAAPSAGGGDGGFIDPTVLEDISPTFDQISTDTANVSETVGETVEEDMTWGLCGAMGFASTYNERAQELKELHSQAAESMGMLATNIASTAADWRDTDDVAAAVFQDVNGEFGE